MKNIPCLRSFKFAFVFILATVLFPSLPVKAQIQNNDYYTAHNTSRNKALLKVVEEYHFNNKKFFKWFEEGNYSHNLGDLRYVLRYFPNHPGALRLLGRMSTTVLKDPTLPLPYYRKALELFPWYAHTHAQFGKYYIRSGKHLAEIGEDTVFYKAGIAELKKAIEINPEFAEAYAWLAKAYHKIDNSELALKAAEQAKQLGYEDEKLDKMLKDDH